jgi:hypothetical protein
MQGQKKEGIDSFNQIGPDNYKASDQITGSGDSYGSRYRQCPSLHAVLNANGIEAVEKGMLRASWRGPASGLDL